MIGSKPLQLQKHKDFGEMEKYGKVENGKNRKDSKEMEARGENGEAY